MAIDYRLIEELKRRSETQSGVAADRSDKGGGNSGEPPDDPGLRRRVSALEASFLSVDKTLAVMSEQLKHLASREELRTELAIISTKLDGKASAADLATLSGKVDRMASATELAELKGRVARIPTLPTLTSILVFVSLLFAAAAWALRHLPDTWSRAFQ